MYTIYASRKLGEGEELPLYEKHSNFPICLQSKVLTAFCTLKLCARILNRQIEPNIVRIYILHSLMVNTVVELITNLKQNKILLEEYILHSLMVNTVVELITKLSF